jgi:hypothetical protein
MKRLFAVLAVALFASLATQAQAPAPLPGFGISVFAGYTGISNQGLGSGFETSFAAPFYTNPGFASGPLKNDAITISGRINNFNLLNPAANSLTGGPEFRFQFSSAKFLNGIVLQPFFNGQVGAVRSSCVALQNCAAGQDSTSHFAYGGGFGIDYVTSSHITWRLLEYDRVQSKFFPGGGVTLSNANQFITGLAFKF